MKKTFFFKIQIISLVFFLIFFENNVYPQNNEGLYEKIDVFSEVLEKIENQRGLEFHWGFWIERPSGICWFWLQRGILSLKSIDLCCKCDGN